MSKSFKKTKIKYKNLVRKSFKIGRKCGKICHHTQLVPLNPKNVQGAKKSRIINF